ncbi:MAG: hypothetical protein ACIAQZ_08445 [Sedimentisphaeraceae bacterium JB056]
MRKILLLLFCLLSISVFADKAENTKLPNENTLGILRDRASDAWARFESKSFLPLVDYYFYSSFSQQQHRKELENLTVEYESILTDIYNEQASYTSRIEEYEGDDWDLRFGKNALWRKFNSLENQTLYLIAKCLYYRLLCVESDQFEDLAQAILEKCGTIEGGINDLFRDMLEARVYMLIRESDEGYYDQIFKRLDKVEMEMSSDTALYYEMWMCRLELLKPFSLTQLNRIIDNFKDSDQVDNMVLAMRLAFLQKKAGQTSLLEYNLEKWPQLAALVASMLYEKADSELDKANATNHISSLTHYEKQLLAWASLDKDNPKLDVLIASFGIGQDRADRVISYVAAVKNAEDNPELAVEAAMNALSKPAYDRNVFSDINDLEVLKIATKAGFLLIDKKDYTDKIIDIFDRYKKLAGDNAIEELVFAYSVKMKNLRGQKATALLNEIHENGGEFADKALFEILVSQFNDDKDISGSIEQLYSRSQTADIVFLTDVTDLYCRYLASKERLPKAVQLVAEGYEQGLDFDSGCGLYVLEKFLEKAEYYILQASGDLANTAVFISDKIISDQQQKPSIQIVCIETQVLAGRDIDSIGPMPEYNDQFDTLQYSRSKARYMSLDGQNHEAAFVWGKISRALVSASPLPLWRWQRAKYYQIECSLKSDKVSDEDLLHSIEVLQADSNWKQGYWADKLEEIKLASVNQQERFSVESQ